MQVVFSDDEEDSTNNSEMFRRRVSDATSSAPIDQFVLYGKCAHVGCT